MQTIIFDEKISEMQLSSVLDSVLDPTFALRVDGKGKINSAEMIKCAKD
jgi:hypothetical protein